MSSPSKIDIDAFITQDVAKKILKRYLTGTNVDKLKRCGTMDNLETLIKEVLKFCYNKYNKTYN